LVLNGCCFGRNQSQMKAHTPEVSCSQLVNLLAWIHFTSQPIPH